MTDDWRRETMSDLATDSPYYHELRERCPDCGRQIGFTVCANDHDDDAPDYWDDTDDEQGAEDE